MRLLVCGSRHATDREPVHQELESYLALYPGLILIVGYDPDSKKWQGVDQLAYEWAKARSVPVMPFPARWDLYGNPAGPRRNGRMLADAKPDRVLAFPGGRGTENMIGQANAAGVNVVGWR